MIPGAEDTNFLILWGADIGWFNMSAFNHGMMGYKTPRRQVNPVRTWPGS